MTSSGFTCQVLQGRSEQEKKELTQQLGSLQQELADTHKKLQVQFSQEKRLREEVARARQRWERKGGAVQIIVVERGGERLFP